MTGPIGNAGSRPLPQAAPAAPVAAVTASEVAAVAPTTEQDRADNLSLEAPLPSAWLLGGLVPKAEDDDPRSPNYTINQAKKAAINALAGVPVYGLFGLDNPVIRSAEEFDL